MTSTRVVPLLLGALVGAVLGLAAWSFWEARDHAVGLTFRMRHDVLVWLLVFAAFVIGIFLTYVLLNVHM